MTGPVGLGAGLPSRLATAARRPPVVVAALLVVVSFLQSPGRLTFDTKLDLAVDPAGFLGRAAHLWDPEGGFGQLQNQAFGYFFPMGPFFLLGDLAALPAWVVQRTWSALLLVAAFEGLRRLALRALSVPTAAVLVGGLAYALSPRMVSTVGAISAEALVVALLPWVLLPLVDVERWGARRAAALSALAVLLMGGVNATLVLAVLPVPALWILLSPGPRRRLLAWWSGAVGLACLWWLLPLLLLGRYSPPFLDWVEAAADTTGPVGLSAALRGVTHWVAYVPLADGPYWPGPNRLVVQPLLVAATGAVGVLGLVGLALRDLPHGRALRAIAGLGLVLLVLGFASSVQSPWSDAVRTLLDGPLAPLRNVHKADPVLRLPLALGLTWALGRLVAGRPRAGARPRGAAAARSAVVRAAAPLAVTALVLLSGLPLLQGQSRPGPAFEQLPSWWQQVAEAAAQEPGRTLVVPAAAAAHQTWGRTLDEPLQPLAQGPWAVRSSVPLGGAGSTRLLDAVEEVLAGGVGSPALADLLARSGIGQLVVRHDLITGRSDSLSPTLVRGALEGSEGLERVAVFGPAAEATGDLRSGRVQTYPRVELWRVARPAAAESVRAAPLAGVPALSGGPESLLPLLESGLLDPAAPTVLAGEPHAHPDPQRALVTDGLRRRERSFGAVHGAFGPVLTAQAPFAQDRAVHDLLPFDADDSQTTVRYDGVRDVRASTSAADPAPLRRQDPASLPWAALDGNPFTAWRTATADGAAGQWLEVDLPAPVELPSLELSMLREPLLGPAVRELRVETDTGTSDHVLVATDLPQVLQLPQGTETARLRLTVLSVVGPDTGQVGIADLRLPGVLPLRTLRAPADAPPGVDTAFSFAVDPAPRGPCRRTPSGTDCDPGLVRTTDEETVLDRTFGLSAPGSFRITGSVLARPGPAAAALLEPFGGAAGVTASSWLGGSPAVGPRAALDGDEGTAWVADRGDPEPTLVLTLPAAQELSAVRVVAPTAPRTSSPRRMLLRSAEGDRPVALDAEGRGRFAPLVTDRVELTFPEVRPVRGPDGGLLPVGVAEVELAGVLPYAPPEGAVTGAPCGFGPPLSVDGVDVPTRVTGAPADLAAGRPLQLESCGEPLDLAPGEHRVRLAAGDALLPRSLELVPATAALAAGPDRAVTVRRWADTARTVEVAAGPAALLVVPENANDGWTARLDDEELVRTVVDGWQQAWVLPAGAGGTVELVFGPDRTYRLGLAVGAGAALLLVALALRPGPARPGRAAPVRPGPATGRPGAGAAAAGALGVLLAVVVAGGAGAVVALTVLLVVWRYGRPALLAAGTGSLLTVVAVVGAVSGDPVGAAGGALSQLLGVAAVSAVAVAPVAWWRSP